MLHEDGRNGKIHLEKKGCSFRNVINADMM